MKFAFDTNVIISASLFPGSIPARAIDLGKQRGTLLFSADTNEEIDEVLARPRFNRFRSSEERVEFLTALKIRCVQVDIIERINVCRDPDDDKFLELAVNGRATHLVTGDLDLLALHPFRGIPILTPADFVALFDPPASA